MDGELITFYNVYIPPGSTFDFYMQVLEKVVTEAQGLLVCGGDLNITLKPHLDASGKRISQSQKLTRKLNLLIEEMGLVDTWRRLNPTARNYTYYSSPHATYLRIDYFLTFGTDMNKIHEYHIGPMDLSIIALNIYL